MVWKLFVTYLLILLMASAGLIKSLGIFVLLLVLGFIFVLLEEDEENERMRKMRGDGKWEM